MPRTASDILDDANGDRGSHWQDQDENTTAQNLSPNISALSSLDGSENKLAYFTAAGAMALCDLTAFARTMMGDVGAEEARGTIGLGTAATADVTTSPGDATAGRLLKVGDFGWGQAGNTRTNALLNTLTTGGVYQFGPPATGETNCPGNTGGAALVIRYSSDWITQIAFGANDTQLYIRRTQDNGATWSAWVRAVHLGNLVGTVSQSSGVPTGAVVERGSNANGSYTRWADGTQECWTTLTGSVSAGLVWTYPAAFSAAPAVGGTAIATVLSAVCLDVAPGTTSVTVSARDKADARRADTIHIRATGRWF